MSAFPDNNKYMGNTDFFKAKQEAKEYKIRVLGTGIVGWTSWSVDNKPTRFTPENKPRVAPNPLKPPVEFTAFVIWNYDLQRNQVWEFSQKRVKAALEKIESDRGPLMDYDLVILRVGMKEDTRYTIRALPSSKTPIQAIQMLEIEPINLYALYEGKDPFLDMEAGKEGLDESSDVA